MITISFVGLLVAIIAGTIVGQLIISLIEKRQACFEVCLAMSRLPAVESL